ncbi:unnamed protein product [Prunus armeniaca]|uniref:Uncharacterized protein n=1 Tax=Prunus armeniaca TaxID=36596 RepID=A0A6J5XI60_PRUAR|nr:unnamed protein product [Prunus armeniaca]CAB4311655.1 unnamed protein product [Prunus armeniaca]
MSTLKRARERKRMRMRKKWRVKEVKLKGEDEHGCLKEKWVLRMKVRIVGENKKMRKNKDGVVAMLGLELVGDG